MLGLFERFLYNKITNEKLGGLVCERNGNVSENRINEQLMESLMELYNNGYSDKYELRDIEIFTNTMLGSKKFNTVMVCIVFQTYEIEIE